MDAAFDTLKLIFMISAGCGGLFLIVVPIGAAIALSDDLRSRLLGRVPAWTVDDLLTVKSHPRRVAVRGATAGSSVPAPATGTRCLWFRVTVRRVDKVATESGDRWDETVVWSSSSGDHVWFHDGTGTVPVEVPLLERSVDGKAGLVERALHTEVDGDEPYLRHMPRSALKRRRNTARFTVDEDVVRDDVTATLFVRPVHRDGQLVLAGGLGYRVGVTGLTQAEVADRYSGEAREGWWTVRFLLIIGGALYLCGAAGVLLIR